MNTKIEGFNIEEWFTHSPVQSETFTEMTGEVITEYYKRLHLGEHLSVYVDAETGQAFLEHHESGDGTFLLTRKLERMFLDFENVNLAELFAEIYKNRWVGIYG